MSIDDSLKDFGFRPVVPLVGRAAEKAHPKRVFQFVVANTKDLVVAKKIDESKNERLLISDAASYLYSHPPTSINQRAVVRYVDYGKRGGTGIVRDWHAGVTTETYRLPVSQQEYEWVNVK